MVAGGMLCVSPRRIVPVHDTGWFLGELSDVKIVTRDARRFFRPVRSPQKCCLLSLSLIVVSIGQLQLQFKHVEWLPILMQNQRFYRFRIIIYFHFLPLSVDKSIPPFGLLL